MTAKDISMCGESTIKKNIKINNVSIGNPVRIKITPSSLPDTYKGAYEAIPKISEQNFPTEGKTMTKDFKVKGIPSYEVDNLQGGVTFIIGGN